MKILNLSTLMQKFDESSIIVIAGAGGFIGGHLVDALIAAGFARIRCVDIKPMEQWYQVNAQCENLVLDLSDKQNCLTAMANADHVFNLACNMGGMGFIENNRALCMISVLINTHLLMAASEVGVKRFLFSSSACVYNADKQKNSNVTALKEDDAYPAMPEDGYGWEKLFSERMSRHFLEDYGLDTRIVRFHNVYGPNGTYDGGREKAPAAICRKIIEAKLSGKNEIEVWGDGEQTRSFLYIDDGVEGLARIFSSDVTDPLNLGSDELVTINQLIDIIEEIAELKVKRNYKLDAPLGVRGRNSDNTLIKETLGWAPSIRLHDGLEKTYAWIYDQIVSNPKT